MSARKQAREAGIEASFHDSEYDDVVRAEEAADAASDVWEPLLRELAFVAQQLTYTTDDPKTAERFEEALAQAWWALS
jgi:hypothetical protein